MLRRTLVILALSTAALSAMALSSCDRADPGVGEPAALSTVQSLYLAAADNDQDTLAALLGDDVEWVEAEGGPFEAGNPYIGIAGVGSGVFGPIAQDYADFAVTPERYTVQGGRVVVEGRYTGTHRRSGAALDAQFAHVFTTEGGRILRFQQYTDTHQWRRLAEEAR